MTSLSPGLLEGFFTTAFLLFLAHKFIIYPNFLCPIRHIPGPYITKCTSYWLIRHGFWDSSNQWMAFLHSKYGPVVRIAPDKVSFNTIKVIPQIYGVRSQFCKIESAAAMDNYGFPNTFSSVSNEDHRRRRSRYASVYSKSNMTTGPGYESIRQRTKKVLGLVRQAVQLNQSVDIYQLFHYYSIDNASVIASGTSPHLLSGKNLSFSTDLRTMFLGLSYVSYFAVTRSIIAIIKHLPNILQPPLLVLRPVKSAYEAHFRVEEFNLKHFESSRSAENPEFGHSVLAKLLEHKDFGGEDLSLMHVASELSDHLLAGADTLVASITYTFWELARPEHKQSLERLITEVKTLDCTPSGIPNDYTQIDGLIWLECCLKEGLRLHTPSGHIQSRMIPPGGSMLAGYFIPESLEVGISLYTIQLNPSIFQGPLDFNPSRWLSTETNMEELSAMNKAYMTFGHGARVCVGKELAIVQSKLLLSTLLSAFTVQIDQAQDHQEMTGIQANIKCTCKVQNEEDGWLRKCYFERLGRALYMKSISAEAGILHAG